jgi:hypothetical protein
MSESTRWNADIYARNARFVSDFGAPLLQLLDPRPGEVILDLGCGDGALTEKTFGSTVYAVDTSRGQIRLREIGVFKRLSWMGADSASKDLSRQCSPTPRSTGSNHPNRSRLVYGTC